MSEFHPDDKVINIHTGQRFTVAGMMKSTTAGTLYCGGVVGWTREEDLDYDLAENQKKVFEEVERLVHDMRTSAGDMTAKLILLKNDFGGILPRPLVVEIEAIILMLRSHLR